VFVAAHNGLQGASGQNFVRVYKLGTTSGFPDCAIDTATNPPVCMGLVFQSEDTRAVTSTGNWSSNYKAECPLYQAAQGLSIEASTSRIHALYCGRAPNSKFSPHSGCRTVDFQSTTVGSSWDGSNIAGECNAGEYVAGVAQIMGSPTHLLCCPGTALAKTSCSPLTLSTTSNVPATGHDYIGQDWDVIGYPPAHRTAGMATCVGGKYLAGVSHTTSLSNPKPSAILCCSP
jgi:hypothetical protein